MEMDEPTPLWQCPSRCQHNPFFSWTISIHHNNTIPSLCSSPCSIAQGGLYNISMLQSRLIKPANSYFMAHMLEDLKFSANPCKECEDRVETRKDMNTSIIISNSKCLSTTSQRCSPKLRSLRTRAIPNPPWILVIYNEAFSHTIERNACIGFQLLTRSKWIPSRFIAASENHGEC